METGVQRKVLRGYLLDTRDEVNREIERLFGGDLKHHEVLYSLMMDYPLRGGKALRPALAIAMCRALGGYREAILPTAATLELYHNAFLIHDDVEDESLLRRGGPTLHSVHGTPIAVNVGDAMLVLSLQPLLDNIEVVGLGPALKILRLVAHMTRRSVEGQATELAWVRGNVWDLSDSDYSRMVVEKTGWYSFIAPLQAGAIVARAEAPQLEELEAFGRVLSVAFQIRDDILNVSADPEPYGKEIGGDLWEGKRTIMLLHAIRSSAPDDRARALSLLSKPRPPAPLGLTDSFLDELVASGDLTLGGRDKLLARADHEAKTHEDVAWLHDLMIRHGSIEYAGNLAERRAAEAGSMLERMTWIPPSGHRSVLEEIVAYVGDRDR